MMLKYYVVVGFFVVSVLVIGVVFVVDVEVGKVKVVVCVVCYGQNGIVQIFIYLNLVGQNEQYLVLVIKVYKNKQCNGGQVVIMQGQVVVLSDIDIVNLVVYYVSFLVDGGK